MTNNAIGLSLPICLGENGFFKTNTTSIDQVRSNIKNILLTMPGERRFNNKFGSGLYKLLFEQSINDVNEMIVKDIIQRDIDTFLNGVYVTNVTIKKNDNPSSYNNRTEDIFIISIIFEYNKSTTMIDLELVI